MYANQTTDSRDYERVVIAVASGMSIVCSLVILTSFVFLKEVRTITRQIIMCITLSDFCTAVANLGGVFITTELFHGKNENSNAPAWCTMQSFVSSTSSLWSFLWTMMFSVALYLIIKKENTKLLSSLLPWLHITCWLLPLVINVVALCKKKLGYAQSPVTGGWCWIAGTDDPDTILWMTIDGKGIEIFTYLVIVVMFCSIKCHLRDKIRKLSRSDSPIFKHDRTLDAMKVLDKKLIFIPVVLISLRIWGTIRYFIYIHDYMRDGNVKISPTHIDNILKYLQAAGDSSQSTMNIFLFCFCTPKIRSKMIDFFTKQLCGCCGNRHNENNNMTNEEDDENTSLLASDVNNRSY